MPLSTIARFDFFIVPTGGILFYQFHQLFPCLLRVRRGDDRMVDGFTTTLQSVKLEFEPRSLRGVIDTTLCDTVCQ